MESPIWRPSTGHVGIFDNLPPDSPYYEGELFSVNSAPHPGVIKFEGIFIPPFYQVLKHLNSTFTVFGPWFSLACEAAKKINHTLVGDFPKTDDPSDLWSDFFQFRADIGLMPMFPATETVIEAIEMSLIELGPSVGMFEMDHILSKRREFHVNLLAMVAPFDPISFCLVSLGLFITSFYSTRFEKDISKPFRLHQFLWSLMTSLIVQPSVSSTVAIWRLIGLTWLLGTFFLYNLFSGDMFTAMAAPAELDVVHTWLDLATKSNDTITLFASIDSDVDKLISAEIPRRDSILKRIAKLPYEHVYKFDLLKEIMANVSSGNAYHLNAKHVLDQYKMWFSDYRDEVYVSEEYGQYMPYFVPVNPFAQDVIKNAFNLIILQTRESGIFNQWVKAYGGEEEVTHKALAEYEQAKVMHFIGLFAICGGMLATAFLAFLYELLLRHRKTSGIVIPDVFLTLSWLKCFGWRESFVEESNNTFTEEFMPKSYYRHRLDAFEQIWNDFLDDSYTETNTE